MAGVIQPLKTVYKGESKLLVFTVYDSANARVDLTGASIEFQVNYPLGPPYAALIAKSTSAGGVSLGNQSDPTTRGDFSVSLTPDDTKNLTAKRYKYDVWVTIAGVRRAVVPPSDFNLLEVVNGA